MVFPCAETGDAAVRDIAVELVNDGPVAIPLTVR